MSFSQLETEALDSNIPSLSHLLSIAWARVPPTEPDIDAAALQSLRRLIKDDPLDCDDDSRAWLSCHGISC